MVDGKEEEGKGREGVREGKGRRRIMLEGKEEEVEGREGGW